MDYWGILNSLFSADYENGRLSQKFLPGYPEQRGRAQLAKSRAHDETVKQAKAMEAAREFSLRELANNQALANYNAERGQPMALAGPQPQRPYPGMGAPVRPQQRPYPGMGAPVRPPMVPPTAAIPVMPKTKPRAEPKKVSDQDYYNLIKEGLLRLG